jgi:hypothetical protein
MCQILRTFPANIELVCPHGPDEERARTPK